MNQRNPASNLVAAHLLPVFQTSRIENTVFALLTAVDERSLRLRRGTNVLFAHHAKMKETKTCGKSSSAVALNKSNQ